MGKNSEKRRSRRETKVNEDKQAHQVARVQKAGKQSGPARFDLASAWARAAQDQGTSGRELSIDMLRFCVEAFPHGEVGATGERLSLVMDRVAALLCADAVAFLEPPKGDDASQSWQVAAFEGSFDSDEARLRFTGDNAALQEVRKTRKLVSVTDLARDERFPSIPGGRSELASLLLVPMTYRRHLLGILAVARKEVSAFGEADLVRAGEVANGIALDLQQVRLAYESMFDPVSGLQSRAAFIVDLPRHTSFARRQERSVTLVLLTLANLESLRATYGDGAAGLCVREAAARIKKASRHEEPPYRIDAAALTWVALGDQGAANAFAERLFGVLTENPVSIEGVDIPLEVEIRTMAVAEEGSPWETVEGLFLAPPVFVSESAPADDPADEVGLGSDQDE